MLSYHIRYGSTLCFCWNVSQADALLFALYGSCLVQIQFILQNTTGQNVGNRTEDDIFCGENAKESEERSCVGHKSSKVVKSDAEKQDNKEYKVNYLIDCVDNNIAEDRTDNFILADNLTEADGKIKI